MSQAGEIDVVGAHPDIPVEFIANVGTAVPIANQLEILAEAVAAGIIPAQTVASGNTLTTQIQRTQAFASSSATRAGLASFDSSEFTVDANGFVQLNGTGAGETITGQSGGALSPTAGNWNIFGASTAAGTSPVVTSGAVSTLTVNVQKSQAIAATDSTKVGLSNFNSAQFSVDANGFVTLLGGGEAIDSIGVDATSGGGTNPVLPSAAGLVTVNGAVVAASTTPVRSVSTAANVYQIQVQTSQALAAADATKIGLSNFDSAAFDVDANGFVQLNGGGIASTSFDVQANTAPGTDPVVPTSAGVVTVNGAVVANHSVVLETRSRAANAYNVEVQYATSAASTDGTKSGVAHFLSTDFTVDANGFVSLTHPACVCAEITGDLTLVVNTCYRTNFAETATLTLPSTAALCDVIEINFGSQGLPVIAQNAGQRIQLGNQATTIGVTGSLTSVANGDCILLKCVVAGASTRWTTIRSMGNWQVT